MKWLFYFKRLEYITSPPHSENPPKVERKLPFCSLQSVVDLSQGLPKKNPENGQNEIWTQEKCIQTQQPDHWAMLPSLIN